MNATTNNAASTVIVTDGMQARRFDDMETAIKWADSKAGQKVVADNYRCCESAEDLLFMTGKEMAALYTTVTGTETKRIRDKSKFTDKLWQTLDLGAKAPKVRASKPKAAKAEATGGKGTKANKANKATAKKGAKKADTKKDDDAGEGKAAKSTRGEKRISEQVRDILADGKAHTAEDMANNVTGSLTSVKISISVLRNPDRCGENGPMVIAYDRKTKEYTATV